MRTDEGLGLANRGVQQLSKQAVVQKNAATDTVSQLAGAVIDGPLWRPGSVRGGSASEVINSHNRPRRS